MHRSAGRTTLGVIIAFFASFICLFPRAGHSQAPSVLHIKIVLVDAQQQVTPVARHALLISEEPASSAPRRVITALDGTADVRLRPGRYTVESDQPVAFQGQAYGWTQSVQIAAGRDAVLELTAANAEVGAVVAAPDAAAAPLESDPTFLLPQWQASIVSIWTPNLHASGFVIDAKGLIVTNQQVIGNATSVEVQLTPAVKVAARVLVADSMRDVAVLWIDPKVMAVRRPVPLECGDAAPPPVVNGQQVVTIGAPLRGDTRLSIAAAGRVESHVILADFVLPPSSEGGPVFTAAGRLIGITTLTTLPAGQADNYQRRRQEVRIVPIADACGIVAAAEKKMTDATPPSPTALPVEPARPFPAEALKGTPDQTRDLAAYQMSSSDFDVTFITPLLTYGAQHRPPTGSGGDRGRRPSSSPGEPSVFRSILDFGNWSEYVADYPPVLLVRVTPRLVEGFWTMMARGAARTQGVSLPPIKRFKPGFARMRAFCGETEVTPIHPFRLQQRITDDDAIYEGLYAFEPGALGPPCGKVRLVLHSEKEPEKGDTRIVEPKLLQQVWEDFSAFRAAGAQP